jgi:three-Cys-motif partner protein
MHVHGGGWTDDKLEVIQRYFSAYAKALKNSPSADRPFQRIYVDAFAGTGDRTDSKSSATPQMAPLFADESADIIRTKEGSVRIALGINPPFHRYVLVDRSPDHVAQLEKLRAEFAGLEIDVRHGDANDVLRQIAAATNWKGTRAAIFIDPYGMQVDWETLQALARTKAVDIALLFPTGPLNRMLARSGDIPDEWAARIDSHLGPCSWRTASYRETVRTDLFDAPVVSIEKTINAEGLRQFVFERLRSIFAYVCPQQLEMRNSRGAILYHLFIICANDSEPAKRLADKLARSAVRLPQKATRK